MKDLDACICRAEKQIPADKWKLLGRELGFSDVELSHIECNTKYEAIQETIHQMLVDWKQRHGTDATVKRLATALHRVDLWDVACQIFPSMQVPRRSQVTQMSFQNRISTELNAPEQEFVSQLRVRLGAEYQNLTLPGVEWDNFALLPIEEMHVDLTIIERDKYRRHATTEDIELNQIFRPSTKPNTDPDAAFKKRCLMFAGPGYGKTSTLKKIAFDWAKGETYLEQFDIVIFTQLRHIRESLEELIEDKTRASILPTSVYPVLDKIQDRVLLLLDGYDELPQKQIKDLDDLLRSEIFPKMTVVVSSRNVPFPKKDETVFWNRLIEIKGFSEERAKLFLSKYLKQENPQHVWKKLDAVLASKGAQLLSCPLFLLLVGRMVEEQQLEHITNRIELFKAALNFMVKRSLVRKQLIKSEKSFDIFPITHYNLSHVLKSVWAWLVGIFTYFVYSFFSTSKFMDSTEVFRIMLQFGEFSWQCLKTKTVCFERSELLKYCQNEIVFEMGFLMESDKDNTSRKVQLFYEPIHKTFMEFAAALYLAQQIENLEFRIEIQKQIKALKNDAKVNLFSCLLFLDEMTGRKLAILSFLKELSTASSNFWHNLLKDMPTVNEAESFEICREFDDFMRPFACAEDCSRQFGLSRLKLKQIKEFQFFSNFSLPNKCIQVETLVIKMVERYDANPFLPDMYCKRAIFTFGDRKNYDDAIAKAIVWKRFVDIVNHFQDMTKSGRVPNFPEIRLRFYSYSLQDLKNLTAVKNFRIHSLEFETRDILSPHFANLIDALNITSELILHLDDFGFLDDESLFKKIDLLKKIAKRVDYKIRMPMSSGDDYHVLVFNFDGKPIWSVEQLVISSKQIHRFDFSLCPDVRSLRLTVDSDDESVNFSSLFQVINRKAPRIGHIIIDEKIVEKSSSNPLAPGGLWKPDIFGKFFKTSSIKQHECSSSRADPGSVPTKVDEITVLDMAHRLNFVLEQLKPLLVDKQILRLYVQDHVTAKYDLQKYFPSSEFEIECVHRPLRVSKYHYCDKNQSYLQYGIKLITL